MAGGFAGGAAAGAAFGKRMSSAVRSVRTGGSSGASASSRMGRAQKYIMANKGKSAMMGGAGAAGLGMGRSRRSGLDKSSGRSTGMYKY